MGYPFRFLFLAFFGYFLLLRKPTLEIEKNEKIGMENASRQSLYAYRFHFFRPISIISLFVHFWTPSFKYSGNP